MENEIFDRLSVADKVVVVFVVGLIALVVLGLVGFSIFSFWMGGI